MKKLFRKKKKSTRVDILIGDKTPFAVTEAYKTLRTNVGFASTKEEGRARVIAVCSSLPSEGKTMTTANLGLVFSQANYKTVVIDCDLRKPRVHKFFHLKNNKGITEYLCGNSSDAEECAVSYNDYLKVVVSGQIPPNPMELMTSAKMKELIDHFAAEADIVLIDTPPLDLVSDCVALADKSDGVILVVKHMESVHPAIEKSLQKLEFAKMKVFGMVLNDYKEKKSNHYYHSYYKGYYKGYYRYARDDNENSQKTEQKK